MIFAPVVSMKAANEMNAVLKAFSVGVFARNSPMRAPMNGPAIIPHGPMNSPANIPIPAPHIPYVEPPPFFVIHTGAT